MSAKTILSLFLFTFIILFIPKAALTVGPGCDTSPDTNNDGTVDSSDRLAVQGQIGQNQGDPGYHLNLDINCDDQITQEDFDIVYENSTDLGGDSIPGGPVPQYELPITEIEEKGFNENNLVGKLVSVFLPIVFSLAGFLTVIFIVISGIQFVTSGGNPEAAAAARGRLTFAIIGFVLIVLAFSITQLVDRIFLGGSGVF